MNLLNNLTGLMNAKNINRSELARNIGIAPSTINSWYNRSCDNISLQTLLKLSQFFQVSIEELVNGECGSITFTEKDYTQNELKAIVNFSEFIKTTRIEISNELIDIEKIREK